MGNSQLKTSEPEALNESFSQLVEQFLAERFSQENQLAEATLENLEQVFQEIDEQIEEGNPPRGFDSIRDSYEKSKEIYCLLLMELESLNWRNQPSETLSELRERENHTTFIQTEPPSSQDGSTPSFTEEEQNSMDLQAELEAIEQGTIQQRENQLNEEDFLLDDSSEPSSHLEEEQNSLPNDPFELGEAFSNNDSDDGFFDPSGSPSAVTLDEDTKEKTRPAAFKEAHIDSPESDLSLREPSDEDQITETFSTGFSYGEDELTNDSKETKEYGDENHHPTAQAEAGLSSHNPIALELFEIAKHFEIASEQKQLPLNEFHARRLQALCWCQGLELECQAKLTPLLKRFFKEKDAAIRTLLDTKSRQYALHPLLHKAVEELSTQHKSFLGETGYPIRSALNSMRFLLSVQPDHFRPTLQESSTLIFFFGQNLGLNGIQLENYLGLNGLTTEEITELSFRLSRTQKLKNQSMKIEAFSHSSELREDCSAIINLLSKIHSSISVDTEE